MKPLIVLLSTFAIALFVLKLTKGAFEYALSGRIAMAAMLLFTAIGHFAFTKGMAAMLPDFIPAKTEVVILTGVLEIFLSIGLLLPNYRHTIAWVLIIFLILILPANIKAAIENINYQTGESNGEGLNYLWFRIPLQVFFLLWTYLTSIKN
jgi:uncharacterized membrane protein